MKKEEILEYLKYQRSMLKEEINENGSTFWAIVGGLAALSWLTIDLVTSDKIDLATSLQISILLFLSLKPLDKFINRADDSMNSVENYFYQNIIGHIDFRVTYVYFSYAAIFYSFNYLGMLHGWSLIVYNTIFVIGTLVAILTIIILYWLDRNQIVIPKKTPARSKKFGNLFFLIVFFIPQYIVAYGLLNILINSKSIVAESIKLGFVVFAIHFLIFKLIRHKNYAPLIQSLENLIENVTFDRFSNKEANQKLKTLLFGLTFKEIISTQISKYINVCNQFKSSASELNNKILQFESLVIHHREDDVAIKKVMDEISNEIKSLSNLTKFIKRQNSIISKNVIFSSSIQYIDNSQVSEVQEILETNVIDVQSEFENLSAFQDTTFKKLTIHLTDKSEE